MISTDKEFEVFGNFAEKFGMGKLQDMINIKKYLESHEYSMDDVEVYVEWEIKRVEEKLKNRREEYEREILPIQQAMEEKFPECPKCGQRLYIISIAEVEGSGNVYGYKSVWQCGGKECTYEEYNKESKGEIVASYIGEEQTKKLGFI